MATHTQRGSARKYGPLTDFLRRQSRDRVRMSFGDIERVIDATLPRSATEHRAWWSNNAENNVMTKAWKAAGFESEDVDMNGRRVTFRRVRSEEPRDADAPSFDLAGEDRHPLIGWMKGTLITAEGVDLALPADSDWGGAAYGDSTSEKRK